MFYEKICDGRGGGGRFCLFLPFETQVLSTNNLYWGDKILTVIMNMKLVIIDMETLFIVSSIAFFFIGCQQHMNYTKRPEKYRERGSGAGCWRCIQ